MDRLVGGICRVLRLTAKPHMADLGSVDIVRMGSRPGGSTHSGEWTVLAQ